MICQHHKFLYMLLLCLSIVIPASSYPLATYQIQTSSNKTQQHKDALLLSNALDYFMSEKYHESLLILQQLDKKYRLNPRYLAYLGVCYYYEWDYKHAIKYLNEAIPQLENFDPHERSLYFYDDAESYFYLSEYEKAIPLYQEMLTLCYKNEKADALYRIGFCYMFTKDWMNARDYFAMALLEYKKYRNTSDMKARIIQITNMIIGCQQHLPKGFYQIPVCHSLISDQLLNTTQKDTLINISIKKSLVYKKQNE